jgi:intein/homing endonuclease
LNYEKEDKKTVPASIFTSNPLVQAALIRGLFEADGSVGREGAGDNGIRFVNTAPAVAYGAHLILTNLGILASCRLEREDTDTRKVIYSVTISGIDTQHYRNKIDFIAYRKRARLKALAEKSKGKTNVDYLPMPLAKELPVKLYATLKTHGLSLWKMRGIPFESVIRNAMYNNHGLSIRGAQIALAFLEDKFKDHPDFTQTIATLHEYTDHRIFFDTITEIKEVEPRPLLDIEVPETHSYWTNGFVSHNSAKGLEWKTVFVWSVVEGCLPHWRSSGDEKELTEERRLFYVAVTRARDFAYLCVPGKIPRGQNMSFAEMSRFLVELGVKP